MFQACTSQTWTKCGSSFVIQSASCAISKNLSSSCRSVARIHSALEISPRKPPSATVVNASTGGRVLQRLHARQAEPIAVAVQRLLHKSSAGQQHGGEQEQERLLEFAAH